jgi:ERCC4-type nuclease
MILVSPTEPASIRSLGRVSPIPERYGGDVVIVSRRLVVVQRKTVPDLIASVQDGRLAREIPLLRRHASLIVLEGLPTWTTDGVMTGTARWPKSAWYGILVSLSLEHEIPVVPTQHTADTRDFLLSLSSWMSKPSHTSLIRRPTPKQVSPWRHASDRDVARWILMGLPGVGPHLADAILDTLGLPIRWTCSLSDLERVPGIGPSRAKSLYAVLGGDDVGQTRRDHVQSSSRAGEARPSARRRRERRDPERDGGL